MSNAQGINIGLSSTKRQSWKIELPMICPTVSRWLQDSSALGTLSKVNTDG